MNINGITGIMALWNIPKTGPFSFILTVYFIIFIYYNPYLEYFWSLHFHLPMTGKKLKRVSTVVSKPV